VILSPDRTIEEDRLKWIQVYALRDPNSMDLRYVGKAADPKKRFVQHLTSSQLRARSHKNSWLKGLIAAGQLPWLEIVDEVEADRADEAERYWIAWYRSQGAPLTNGTNGGDGGAITCPDARARISAAHLGSKRTVETRARMSETAKRRAADPKERERLRSISNGKPPVHNGEANPRTKLTDEQVREMRTRAAAGAWPATLAAEYGITMASVTQLVTGKYRVAAGGPIREAKRVSKLSEEDVVKIRRLVADGAKQRAVATQFGIHPSHVSDIVSGKRRSFKKE
jgi:DNA-binding transcriptional regulator YdaS (Cro superfamily)